MQGIKHFKYLKLNYYINNELFDARNKSACRLVLRLTANQIKEIEHVTRY